MIYVNCAAEQNAIIEMLETFVGEIKYVFEKKTGIKLAFNVNTDDLDKAVDQAKAIIKDSKVGKALYFQVVR